MKKVSLLIIPCLTILMAFTFLKPKPASEAEGIKWMTWQEVVEAEKKQPKKVFVDVYTDWCGWCKRMDATTFTNPVIIKYINDNYYAIKFNAETKQPISLNGKEYNFVAQGNSGYHELAAQILHYQMSYPTQVYFDESLNEIFPMAGYEDARDFEQLINYVASNSYMSNDYPKFKKSFKGNVK
jgi:thioredoxin-related protein